MIKYLFIISFVVCISCEDGHDPILKSDPIPVDMQCMDLVTMGGSLSAVVRSLQAYRYIYAERFTDPLQAYWDEHYANTYSTIVEMNPGLTPDVYDMMVHESFYSTLPFRGTEDCLEPIIDFDTYTLLGVAAHASGCEAPVIDVQYELDPNTDLATLTLTITEIGTCEILHSKNLWVLVPKIPLGAEVKFQRL